MYMHNWRSTVTSGSRRLVLDRIDEMLLLAKAEVSEIWNAPTVGRPHGVIGRYTAAIEGNFLGWMGAAIAAAQTLQAQLAAKENLTVEIAQDHPGMLRAFARAAEAVPTEAQFHSVATAVERVRTMLRRTSGVRAVALMAYLEHTSEAFVPVLARLAERCDSKELEYTRVHGAADAAHADQFTWALLHEIHAVADTEEAFREVTAAFTPGKNLLRAIY